MHVYKNCSPSQQTYIADRLEAAMAVMEPVARARNRPDDKLEAQHGGILTQAEKDAVTDVYARAFHNPPTLVFTCPKRGSELEKICEASLGPEDVGEKTGVSFMVREGNELVLCPAPEVGIDLATINEVAIVAAIVTATLEEQ